jgi:hypothetical protein
LSKCLKLKNIKLKSTLLEEDGFALVALDCWLDPLELEGFINWKNLILFVFFIYYPKKISKNQKVFIKEII